MNPAPPAPGDAKETFWACARRAFRAVHHLPIPANHPPPHPGGADLLSLARKHRMLGLLQADPDLSLTPEERTRWTRAVYGQALHTSRLATEASRIARKLNAELGEWMLIKGPSLAAQAYPEPGLRHYDDLDLRCGREALPELVRAMEELGCAPGQAPAHRQALWRFGWGISFRSPEGFLVEASHRMFPPHYPWPTNAPGEGLSGRDRLLLDGVEIPTASPSLHLLHSSLHLVWHGWERLGWLADVAGLLIRHPEAFAHAEKIAQPIRFARRALHAACAMAEEFFGPGVGPQRLSVQASARKAARTGLAGGGEGTSRERERRCQRDLLGRGPERLRYELKRTCTPGDGDFTAVPLPSGWQTLYWAIRPCRAAFWPLRKLFRDKTG